MNNEQLLAQALAPRSDQLNADDLIVGNKVITITKVLVNLQSEQQKVVVHYVDDNGKPWKPSKSMGRVLAEILGGDFSKWEGEQIELFKNKEITFGKDKCGGIQIAAMSAAKNPIKTMITTKRGVKSKITILPLLTAPQQTKKQARNPELAALAQALKNASNFGMDALAKEEDLIPQKYRADMAEWLTKCQANALAVDAAKVANQEPELVGFTPVQKIEVGTVITGDSELNGMAVTSVSSDIEEF